MLWAQFRFRNRLRQKGGEPHLDLLPEHTKIMKINLRKWIRRWALIPFVSQACSFPNPIPSAHTTYLASSQLWACRCCGFVCRSANNIIFLRGKPHEEIMTKCCTVTHCPKMQEIFISPIPTPKNFEDGFLFFFLSRMHAILDDGRTRLANLHGRTTGYSWGAEKFCHSQDFKVHQIRVF